MAEAAEQLPPPQYPSPLERERESASFIASEMAALLYTQRRIDAKRAVADILRADPVLAKLRSREPFLSKKERFADQVSSLLCFRFRPCHPLSGAPSCRAQLEKTLRFWQMAQEQGWMDEDGMVPSTAVPFARDYAFPPLDGVASNLSDGMFIGAIRGQMSPEQQAKWLPLAQSHQILGTCKIVILSLNLLLSVSLTQQTISDAQTEMGHGSNVRGLETTATFDPATDEFVINSPTISSTKWWPGGLGLISTHAIVYARLIIGETDHGVFPFMVQLRSLEDHLPMPGVTLGTSGPTMGLYANEHGRCRFDHVRIPRDQFCARHNQVTAEGEFIPAPNRKVSYFTMVQTRVGFVTTAGAQLAKALTIAIRYSAVRRQGFPAEGVSEPVVLDYQMQQHIMFTLLSKAFALHFTARYMSDVNRRAQASDGGDDALVNLALLPELHATSAGLKAISTSCKRPECRCVSFVNLQPIGSAISFARRHGGRDRGGAPCVRWPRLRSLLRPAAGPAQLPADVLHRRRQQRAVPADRTLPAELLAQREHGRRRGAGGECALLRGSGGGRWRGDRGPDMQRRHDRGAVRSRGATCSVPPRRRPQGAAGGGAHGGGGCRGAGGARGKERAHARADRGDQVALHVHRAERLREPGERHRGRDARPGPQDTVRFVYAHHHRQSVRRLVPSLIRRLSRSDLRTVRGRADALHTMEANIGDFVNDGYLSGEQADLVSDGVVALLGVVRPDAVALVDSFDFDDELELHNSAIGSQDGDVYTRLYEWSNKDPLNGEAGDGAVVEGAEEMLLPFMRMNAKL